MQKTTWDIATFYNRAWQIIKKHKMLWIFGIAASAGGSSFNSSGRFDSESFKGLENFFSDPQTQKNVLGATDAVYTEPSILAVFSDIPSYIYLLLGAEFIFLLLIFIVIGVLYKAWSTASLLHATENGIQDQAISISDVSQKALPHIRPLLWLSIVPPLLFILCLMVLFAIVSIPFFAGITNLSIVSISILILSVPCIVYVVLRYTLSNIWAPRNVIYHNLSGKNALVSGYQQTKGRFWQMVLLGVVNLIAGIIVIAVPVALGVGIFAAVGLTAFKANPNSLIILAPLGLMIGVAFFIGISLLSGIITSFKTVVWSLAYKTMHA